MDLCGQRERKPVPPKRAGTGRGRERGPTPHRIGPSFVGVGVGDVESGKAQVEGRTGNGRRSPAEPFGGLVVRGRFGVEVVELAVDGGEEGEEGSRHRGDADADDEEESFDFASR